MEFIGKPAINPLIFYSGKFSGYVAWGILIALLSGSVLLERKVFFFNHYIALPILAAGLILAGISLINLGRSTRFGLPTDKTKFKTNGLYRISRNPMYVGFDLITVAAIIYTLHWLVIILGVYSIITYHLIIKGEEKFLNDRFGDEYRNYQMNVRRYL